jgi:hypothetical protein
MSSFLKKFYMKTLGASYKRPIGSKCSSILNLESLECRIALSNYFVSPSGDDHNDGRSPDTAWRSIDRVNQASFSPGDSINFQGGATFNGSLQSLSGGTPNNPLMVTSYGGDRATISSGNQDGIALYNPNGIVITHLALVGPGAGRGQTTGVGGYVDTTVSHIYIDDVDISGYGYAGISIYTDASIRDVRITNVTIHDCAPSDLTGFSAGITVQGDFGQSFLRRIFDLSIDHVRIFNNSQTMGIILSNVSNGVVQRSEVHDINGLSAVIGINAWASDNITFQYNESYRIYEAVGVDGDGIFFGNGVVNSLMQYNYSHDNSGFGFVLVADLPGLGPNSGNTVRYNISENDARFSSTYASLVVAGDVWNAEIYNNTFFMAGDASGSRENLSIWNWTGRGLHFRNNIFGTTGGTNKFFVTNLNSYTTGNDLVFQGNAYFSADGSFRVQYNDRSLFSLSDWQNATSQEMFGDSSVAFVGDPQLFNPGQGGTIGDADLLYTLDAYNLYLTSPVGQAGLDLVGLFGIDPGSQDFYGNPLDQSSSFAMGAYQPPAGGGPAPGHRTVVRTQRLPESKPSSVTINPFDFTSENKGKNRCQTDALDNLDFVFNF